MPEQQRKFPGFTYSLIAKGLNRIPQQLLIGEWIIGSAESKKFTPGSQALRINFIPSCLGVAGPYPKLIPIAKTNC